MWEDEEYCANKDECTTLPSYYTLKLEAISMFSPFNNTIQHICNAFFKCKTDIFNVQKYLTTHSQHSVDGLWQQLQLRAVLCLSFNFAKLDREKSWTTILRMWDTISVRFKSVGYWLVHSIIPILKPLLCSYCCLLWIIVLLEQKSSQQT